MQQNEILTSSADRFAGQTPVVQRQRRRLMKVTSDRRQHAFGKILPRNREPWRLLPRAALRWPPQKIRTQSTWSDQGWSIYVATG